MVINNIKTIPWKYDKDNDQTNNVITPIIDNLKIA